MSKRHTPWFPNVRVFEIRAFEFELLKQTVPVGRLNRINSGSLNFAAKCGNEIINNLIRGSRK